MITFHLNDPSENRALYLLTARHPRQLVLRLTSWTEEELIEFENLYENLIRELQRADISFQTN